VGAFSIQNAPRCIIAKHYITYMMWPTTELAILWPDPTHRIAVSILVGPLAPTTPGQVLMGTVIMPASTIDHLSIAWFFLLHGSTNTKKGRRLKKARLRPLLVRRPPLPSSKTWPLMHLPSNPRASPFSHRGEPQRRRRHPAAALSLSCRRW
jgi:hypothetical protein